MPDYLPGCYRNLTSERDESLAGYVLRLAQANGYSGIREFLHLLNFAGSRVFRRNLLELYTDPEKLARLGRIGAGDAAHLQGHYAEPLPAPISMAEALYREERRVDIDALLPARAQVCPICLRERTYVREGWDLAPITACVLHRSVLIDECPSCGTAIGWDRADVLRCQQCGQDLRTAEPEGASGEALAVVADFAALAPFRCQDGKGQRFVVDWEEMFHLFKVMLLPDALWAEGESPKCFVTESAVRARHAVIEKLGAILESGTYHVFKLRDKVHRSLGPLNALPTGNALRDTAVHYLSTTVGLSKELAAAVSNAALPEDVRAADVYSGRPPSLSTVQEVAEFLEASVTGVARLLKLGVIAPLPEAQIGYDADHLLRARAFLNSLLDTQKLSVLVGMPVHQSDLHPDGLFPRWNPENRNDARVTPHRALELQLQLTARWHRASRPEHWVSLKEVATSVERPCALVMCVAKEIIEGSIDRFTWEPPFSWSDLGVPIDSVESIRRLGRM